MADTPSPQVRTFVVCEEITADASNPHRVCLMYLVSKVRAAHYPAVRPQLCAFAQVTECRGRAEVWVEVRHADTDTVIRRSPSAWATFPNDPLAVHGIPFRLKNLVFPVAGLYWVQLWFAGSLLTQQPITLK